MAEGRRKGAERRESESDSAPRRSAKRRPSRLRRLVYWSLVLGLWLVIAAVGTMVWVTINLPPIQSLEIPKRPPQIEIVGLDGKPLATRGEMHGATVTLKELPPYLPRAFVAIEDRRFYSHFGIDPVGLMRAAAANVMRRSEEHTSELQSPCNLVCRLLLEKKKKIENNFLKIRKLLCIKYK